MLVRHLERLAEAGLTAKVTGAVVLGFACGAALGDDVGWVEPQVRSVLLRLFALPGEVFLALLQMMVVPLVFASIARGIAQFEGFAVLRAVGMRFFAYTLFTTVCAVGIGFTIATFVEPGTMVDLSAVAIAGPMPAVPPEGAEPLQDGSLLDTLIPRNPLRAMVEGQMLEVVSFAGIVGIAMVSVERETVAPLLDLLRATLDVCMAIVRGSMRLAPIAVFGLSLEAAATAGLAALGGLALYVLSVLAGLGTLLGVYALLLRTLGRFPVGRFARAAAKVGTLAFSTSSSAAVMPLSIRTAQDDLDVRPEVARLVVPLGATMNMDGTALYQTVATVFLAQVAGVDLGPGALLMLIVTILTASIGTPSAPGLGIVVLSSILHTVGVPTAALGLVFGVDRLLDMARTAVNVTSDLAACILVDRALPASESQVPPSSP